MGGIVGCAAIIAAIVFVGGLIVSFFARGTLAERFMIAITPAALTFIAVLIVCTRDYARFSFTRRAVQRMLVAREDASEHDFLARFPDVDSTLIAQTRLAIAEFFDVPPQKLYATDRLHEDLRFAALEPSFHSFVLYTVLDIRDVELKPFTFNTADLADIGDLAKEIQRVLDELGGSKLMGNRLK